ncbi:MAG TPA: STT3 domain-containing protein [Polyangia bacterium]|nr:STT3 domain-containing protein [Polyangia bacterium]
MPARAANAIAVGAALIGIAALAFGLRFFATWGGARLDGDYVISHDSDPYYHLRRLEYLARNHEPLINDAFAAAPSGLDCVWPVALEYLALGLDAAVFHGDRGRDSRLLAAGFLPPVVGLLAVLAVFLALARATSPWAAVGGSAIAAVLPGAIGVSAFAAFDHHGLELLAFIVVPLVASRAFAARRTAELARAAIAGAISVGGALLAVDGAYLALGALGAALALIAWQTRRDPEPPDGVRGLAWFCAGAAAGAIGSSALEWSRGWPRLLPHAGRIGLAIAVLGLALAVALRGRRRLAALAVVAAGLALALPALARGAGYLTASGDAISRNIAEAAPLWRRAGALYVAVHAAALALAVAHAWRLRRETRAHFLTASALAGGAIGMVQTKYVFLFALTAPWAIARSLDALAAKRRMRAALAIAVALVVAERAYAGLRAAPSAVSPGDAAFARVARRLDERAPPQEVFRPGARPEWTVAVQPSLGPRLLYLGRRAVTSVPFWGSDALAGQFQRTLAALLARDPAAAEALLDGLRARYVLVDDLAPSLPFAIAASGSDPSTYARGAPSLDAASAESLWSRLLHANGSGLSRFRLIAAAGRGADRVKLFERVAGAQVAGAAPPNAEIVVVALIHTPDGDDPPWIGRARADAAGRFAIAVPYPTVVLRCPSGDRELALPDAAIAAGSPVAADCPPQK